MVSCGLHVGFIAHFNILDYGKKWYSILNLKWHGTGFCGRVVIPYL
jgi:hypothetical protein